jgi:hypothetical protein
MADRQLTRRPGRPSLGGPYEGVPAHLRQPLQHWVIEQFIKDGRAGFRTSLIYRLMAAEEITTASSDAADGTGADETPKHPELRLQQ